MSKIAGISHMTFIVKDIEKTAQLFIDLFDAREVYDSERNFFSISREKFLMINNLWIALMEGDSLPAKTYNHIAFKIDATDYEFYLSKIKQLGLEMKAGRSRIKAEAQSIYFYDYDNHLFELHTGTIEERIAGYSDNL